MLEIAAATNTRISFGERNLPTRMNPRLMRFKEVIAMTKNQDENKSIIIRNVPDSVRKALKMKALAEDKTMQGLILELITRYVSEK
jgi:hypothetical protein